MVRPGYKETEVGEIPEDWEISTIGNNTRWLSGGTPSRDNSEYWNGTVPWISGSTLKSSEIFTSDQFLTKEAVAIGSKMAPLNSTLLLVRGSALHSEIRAGMVVAPVSFNQDVKALIPDRTIEPKFLTFYILGQMGGLLKLVSSAGNSAGVLDTELVKNFCFLKPELKEQKAIAKALSDVDELIISLEKLIAKKRDIKTATMQQLLTGKKRLPGFGGEWNLIRIENDANLKARIGWQALTTKEYLDSGKYYLVTGTDFVGGKVNWSTCHFVDEWRYDQDRNIQLKKGDVLLTKDGTIGKVGYVDHLELPATLNSGVFVIRPINNKFDPLFLYYVLSSRIFDEFLAKITAGSTITHLYQKDFMNFEFLAPDIAEQKEIALMLNAMDNELASLTEKLDKTKAVKQGMMQELLTGRTRLVDVAETKKTKAA